MHLVTIRRRWVQLGVSPSATDRFSNSRPEDAPTFQQPESLPRLCILDSQSAFTVVVKLPGIKAEDIELHLAEDSLALSAARPAQADPNADESFRRQERFTGGWLRELMFPCRVDVASVAAELKDGILTVRLSKAKVTPPRRVAILSAPKSREEDGHVSADES